MSKYPQGSIGLGTLSWHGHTSLQASLQTYAKANFFDLFDDALIYLPDPNEAVVKVAQEFPYRIETSPDNFGILTGMEEIAKRLQTDYIFFTENDCPLIENHAEAQRQIAKVLSLLQSEHTCMARMRHRIHVGEKFDILDKYKRYYPNPDTFAAKIRRTLRPYKAKRLCGNAVYAETHPDRKFPKYIKNAGDGFYLVDTQTMSWTNQSIIVNRTFFLNVIIPYCKSIPFSRGANGFPLIEIELNHSKFWTKSGWNIACSPGLLTHSRLNDREY